MEHHGGKLGRGKVDLKSVQNKIAAVTAKSSALKKKTGGKSAFQKMSGAEALEYAAKQHRSEYKGIRKDMK